jgi:H+/Cl- antiporter ClcA
MGQLLGLSPSICAAAGMAALFCGMTNCPITSILIAFELFGFEGVSYYLIAVAISYAVSGYYGLYNDQTIVYSKYKARYVNHRTRT